MNDVVAVREDAVEAVRDAHEFVAEIKKSLENKR